MTASHIQYFLVTLTLTPLPTSLLPTVSTLVCFVSLWVYPGHLWGCGFATTRRSLVSSALGHSSRWWPPPPLPESISSQGRVGQVFLVTIYCHYSMQERTRQAKQEGRVSVQGQILLRNGKKELHCKYFSSFVEIIVRFKIRISWNN